LREQIAFVFLIEAGFIIEEGTDLIEGRTILIEDRRNLRRKNNVFFLTNTAGYGLILFYEERLPQKHSLLVGLARRNTRQVAVTLHILKISEI